MFRHNAHVHKFCTACLCNISIWIILAGTACIFIPSIYYMKPSLDKFRAKLVIKILYARSFHELKRFIDAAIRSLKKGQADVSNMVAFIDKIIHQLEFIISSTTDAFELGNIVKAKDFLLSTRSQLTGVAL